MAESFFFLVGLVWSFVFSFEFSPFWECQSLWPNADHPIPRSEFRSKRDCRINGRRRLRRRRIKENPLQLLTGLRVRVGAFLLFLQTFLRPCFFSSSSSSSWRLGSSRKRKTRIRNKKKWKRNWWRTRRGGGEERRLLVGRSDTTWHSTGTYTTGWVGRAFAYPPTFSPITQYTPGGGLCLSTHTHTQHTRELETVNLQ